MINNFFIPEIHVYEVHTPSHWYTYIIQHLQGRGVLSKVFVAVGIHDSLGGVALGQVLGASLAINLVVGATVLGEVGRFMDEGSSLSKSQ